MLSQFAVVVAAGLGLATAADDNGGHKYVKHSLAHPFFMDGGMSIPHWDFSGNTVVSDESVRLTPDRQTKRGLLFNTKPCQLESWMMTVEFKVDGQGKTLFGDGFALWYTDKVGSPGSALGNTEIFKGLGIFFDTYDNHQEDHGHPWVSALVNDGTKAYDHDEDGKQHTTGGCQSFFRKQEHPTYVRLTYHNELKSLTVDLNVKGNGAWEECFSLPGIDLPTGYHFGATASTGDLADNHDIISIAVQDAPEPSDALRAKYEQFKKDNPVASMAFASKAVHKVMKKIDVNKIVSNHKHLFKQEVGHDGPRADEPEGMGVMTIILIVLAVFGVAGGAFFFFTKEKQPDPSRFSF